MGRILVAACVLFCALSGWSAEDEYYRAFQVAVCTNIYPVPLRSPFFVDTNNTGFKLTNSAIDLRKVKADCELAGVRLGMSMEEVVRRWGKPRYFWSRCMGGPTFNYDDLQVVFATNSNSVKLIVTGWVVAYSQFDGMRQLSNTNEFNRILGSPKRRVDTRSGFDLMYEGTGGLIDLEFGPEQEYFPGYTPLRRIRLMTKARAIEERKD